MSCLRATNTSLGTLEPGPGVWPFRLGAPESGPRAKGSGPGALEIEPGSGASESGPRAPESGPGAPDSGLGLGRFLIGTYYTHVANVEYGEMSLVRKAQFLGVKKNT